MNDTAMVVSKIDGAITGFEHSIDLSTADTIGGKTIVQHLGMVRGNTIRARHVGKDIMAGLRNIVGGEVTEYAKLLAEDTENSSASQAEAVKATGANWFQWVNYSIQPQVMPRMIGLSIYRLDINFRESAVVGIVGGGGIGATLNTAFSRYEFDTAAAILLIIILIVMGLEYTSSFMRKWVQ